MKFKPLTKEQILISIDRLTRFKPTKEKYLRVFFDIILSNLIDPSFKKFDLEDMSEEEILFYVQQIFNSSFVKNSDNYAINKKLKKYENEIFYNDSSANKLLDNKLDIASAVNLTDDYSPINLKWLKSLSYNENLPSLRREYSLKYPLEKVLLVEGITEETLLPTFSKILDYDFDKEGVQIIPAGGKNQVVKMYYKLIEELKLPIYILLDKDAEDNITQIKPKLRDIDKIHLVSCGEFEDLIPKHLIINTINIYLSNFASITTDDFDSELSTVKNLENIFKTKGLHEFKKAEFAKWVKHNIKSQSDVSPEIETIIKEIQQ